VSQTLGCRDNFDGTDSQSTFGFGDVGGSFGGIGDEGGGNESLSLNVGPQIGYEGQITQTSSLTASDIGRLIGTLVHGPIR